MELANNRLGKKKASKEIILGADEEVVEAILEAFEQKGINAICLNVDDCCMKQQCDLLVYRIDWEEESVYFSPFREDGYCPNVTISINLMTTDRVVEQICGFLEAIKFI